MQKSWFSVKIIPLEFSSLKIHEWVVEKAKTEFKFKTVLDDMNLAELEQLVLNVAICRL